MNKYKDLTRIIILTLIIIFLVTYFSLAAGYIDTKNITKTNLINDAIKRYEQDLKDKKEIDINNYLVKDKDYSNNINKVVFKTSTVIEKGFNYVITYLFSEVDKAVNSK